MDWDYSSPLNGALIAASKNSSNIGLNSTSLFNSSLYSTYDPLLTRYKARANIYNSRIPESIGLFDDLDDLALEVEASELFSRPSIKPTYVPSYYNNNNNNNNKLLTEPFNLDDNLTSNLNNDTSLNNNDKVMNGGFKDDSLNKFEQNKPGNLKPIKNNSNSMTKIPQQPPPKLQNNNNNNNNNYNNQNGIKKGSNPNKNLKQSNNNQQLRPQQQQQAPQTNRQFFQQPQQLTPPQQQQQQFYQPSILSPSYEYQPIPFNSISQGQSSFNNQNIQIEAHNSQQQRLLQYQQRIQQQQQQQQQQFQQINGNEKTTLSELEMLKFRQQQERQQLLAAIGSNNSKHQNGDQNGNNNNNNQININNDNNNYFRRHLSYQNSEASIPSTNADPLNSNSPTPPMLSHRYDRNPNNYYLNKAKTNDDSQENGSYLKALRDARQREQRLAKDKYTSNDYKKYQNNYGFGRDFLPFETETKNEKLEKAKKREEYAKMVKERNTVLNDNVNYGRFANNYAENVFIPKNNSNQNGLQQPKYKMELDLDQPIRRKNKLK